jgi:hypothetical protein
MGREILTSFKRGGGAQALNVMMMHCIGNDIQLEEHHS